MKYFLEYIIERIGAACILPFILIFLIHFFKSILRSLNTTKSDTFPIILCHSSFLMNDKRYVSLLYHVGDGVN